jgi:rsbT co-antagonist protein RsbR
MMNSAPDHSLTAADASRLRRFLNWALITTLVFGLIDLINLIMAPGTAALLNVAADLALAVALLLTRNLARQGRVMTAVWLLCGALWAFAMVLAVTDPWIVTAVAFLPLLAVLAVLPYVERRDARRLSVAAGIVTVLALVVATQLEVLPQTPPSGVTAQAIGALAATCALVFLVLNQFHGRLTETLQQTQAANRALQQSQAELETQVAVRTSELQALLKGEQERSAAQARLLAENAQQRETIRALSVPVLPIAAQVLVMPIVGAVDTERLEILRQEALRSLERARAAVLILDITGVSLVDRAVAQGLLSVVQAARLLGVTVWLVGIRPEVAQAMVELDVDLSAMRTSATLQDVLPAVLAGKRIGVR